MQNRICLKFKCKLFIICTRRGTRQDPPKKVTTLHCAVDITSWLPNPGYNNAKQNVKVIMCCAMRQIGLNGYRVSCHLNRKKLKLTFTTNKRIIK